jgi:hypothetical protein
MRTGTVKLSIYVRNLLLYFLVTILACASLCKKKPSENNYLEPVNVSNSKGKMWYAPSMTTDSKGTIYLAWTEDTTGGFDKQQIFYATKPADGNWSVPVNISNTPKSARMPFITVDRNDNLHLVWQQWTKIDTINNISGWVIFYKYRTNDGNWSVPEKVYWNTLSSQPTLSVDKDSNVHLVWLSYVGRYYVTYATRTKEGHWTLSSVIFQGEVIDYVSLCVDGTGNVHLLFNEWSTSVTDTATLYYLEKPKNENWSEPIKLFTLPPPAYDIWTPTILVDDNGMLHSSWVSDFFGESTAHKVNFYAKKTPAEGWSEPVPLIFNDTAYYDPFASFLFLDISGLHLLWTDEKNFLYSKKEVSETWNKPNWIKVKDCFALGAINVVIDSEGKMHIAWKQYRGSDPEQVYYVSFKP